MRGKNFFLISGVIFLGLIGTFLLFLFNSTSIKNGGGAENVGFKVGLIAVDNKEDNLLVKEVYDSLESSKSEYAGEFLFKEKIVASEFELNVKTLVDNGCSLIYVLGKEYVAVLPGLAEQYKNVDFVIVNSKVKEVKNVTNLEINHRGSGYIKGILAGELTKNKAVAAVALREVPVVVDELSGYQKGIESVDRDLAFYWGYVATSGTGATSVKLVEEYLSYGADVVFPMAESDNEVVLKLLSDRGVKAITNSSSYFSAYKNVVAAVSMDIKGELLKLTKESKEQGLGGGNVIIPVLVEYNGDVDAALKSQVKELLGKVNSGQYDMDVMVPME